MDVSEKKSVEKIFALEFLSGCVCGIAVDERLMIKNTYNLHRYKTEPSIQDLWKWEYV